MQKEFLMIKDIRENPEAIRSVVNDSSKLRDLAEKTCSEKIEKFFFVGCGSSHYAALFAAWPMVNSGLPAYAMPSSEFLFYFNKVIDKNSIVVGISRSGQTAETVSALRRAKENGALTISFTTNIVSELSKICDEAFLVDIGEERSIVMTKSFTSLSLASAMFSANVCEILLGKEYLFMKEKEKLASSAEKVLESEKEIRSVMLKHLNFGIERYVFLGSGPAYPIALEGALKMKETSHVASEAFHTLEFRHGPISAISERLALFMFAFKGESLEASKRLLLEAMEKGAKVTLLTNSQEDFGGNMRIYGVESEENAALLSIIAIQVFTYYYSVGKGRDPDNPSGLTRYIARF